MWQGKTHGGWKVAMMNYEYLWAWRGEKIRYKFMGEHVVLKGVCYFHMRKCLEAVYIAGTQVANSCIGNNIHGVCYANLLSWSVSLTAWLVGGFPKEIHGRLEQTFSPYENTKLSILFHFHQRQQMHTVWNSAVWSFPPWEYMVGRKLKIIEFSNLLPPVYLPLTQNQRKFSSSPPSAPPKSDWNQRVKLVICDRF